MYEKIKISEAKYFYSQMSANFDDREKFTFNLSAFLSSARSVLQYACEEAKTKNGGQAWYDKQVIASSILPFFKDKRDVNIHAEPVHATMHVNVVMHETIGIHASASVVVKDANGNIKYQSPPETPPPSNPRPKTSQTSAPTTIRFKFSDWSGAEDIMTLCQMYIAELEGFVEDGITKGFITG